MAIRAAASPAPPSLRRVDDAARSSAAGLLPASVLATLALLVLPGATVALAAGAAGAELSGPRGWLVTGLVSLGYMLAGAKLWGRHPRSKDLSWGELVLWSWARRRRAEGTLERSAGLFDDEVGELLNPQGRREQVKVLRELNAALEVRDPYTRGHARRVERHAHRIALALRCSDDDIFDVRLAASLHDVGKIKVPDRILRKDGPLDESEWAVMKEHSEVGAELLRRLGNQAVVEAVRSHHERWDGSGYPDGLSGAAIPLGARIIAVADTFDAITSCRPYRDRSGRAHAIAILKAESGKQFDPAVVAAFLSATPHQAAAFAGLAALVAPAARKIVSQWGVVVNKAGAVSLAGTMTASAFTGVAAVERPLAKGLQGRDKAAAVETAPAPSEPRSDDGVRPSDGAPDPRGEALGHSKKAHEGGNGKSHTGGNGKSKAGGDEAGSGVDDKALGHSKKAHEGGNAKSHAGGNGKAKGPEASPGEVAPGAEGAKKKDDPAPDPAPAQAKPPKPEKPEPETPAVEGPAEAGAAPETPTEPPAPAPPPSKGDGSAAGKSK